ncbi:3-dehydro-L-gulonate 2-dehydrogenase [Paenibacillus sp. LMG 31456]|uniref:3-dehydro-L-gulonate 2-dehydrogenase n=1 Tax=Paenibacillus foliorum TaxID=2654974 RepID=A0A972GQT5_9BACL|nr:3-dehydro-L-gulonate 2-dehydrogenase [Paenibacillus foliorum]NOU92102.1 3-dehydro-L-gulonate 2-dehydrogenase [Paenibacillus foliorum]
MNRVSYNEMKGELLRVLLKNGFSPERAELCARLFTDASRDGVYSHGLNRFPSFIDQIKKGNVIVDAEPERITAWGALERWDGQYGPGNLNAHAAMARVIELSREHGLGAVALKNTNHWMRPGNYGWQAAEAGCIGICWTNTMPNMPPWGSVESKIGNNPIVLAVPREGGHIVLDMAMAQFSYGQLQSYIFRGEPLPIEGGYDSAGNLTRDPAAIMETKRTLPIGYWKGSGLSIMLDLIAVMLSGGKSTYDLGQEGGERGISQVFLAFDMTRDPAAHQELAERIEQIVQDLQAAEPVPGSGSVRYPGEETLRRRQINLEQGIPVEPSVWQQVLEL